MDYEAYYYNARSRYYNACSEIGNCENRIYNLENQRRNTVNRINQLSADVRNAQKALEDMMRILKSEEALRQGVATVADKMNEAAANFSGMVSASDVNNKNLSDVYGDGAARTKTILENILNTLKAKTNELDNKLQHLQNELFNEKNNLENIDGQIRAAKSDLWEYDRIRRSASNDMEYYRRKMQTAV